MFFSLVLIVLPVSAQECEPDCDPSIGSCIPCPNFTDNPPAEDLQSDQPAQNQNSTQPETPPEELQSNTPGQSVGNNVPGTPTPPVPSTTTVTTPPETSVPSTYYLTNPIAANDLREVIARFIKMLTGISGSLALAAFVYGGFQWVTAGGDSAQIEAGKKTFKSAVTGLIMIFGAYVALQAIFTVLSGPLTP